MEEYPDDLDLELEVFLCGVTTFDDEELEIEEELRELISA
jgi:hypothetical protein